MSFLSNIEELTNLIIFHLLFIKTPLEIMNPSACIKKVVEMAQNRFHYLIKLAFTIVFDYFPKINC
jgi:diacylglycerol kinase